MMRDAGDQAVETVDEVDGVHHQHHGEDGEDQRHRRRADRDPAERERRDRHTLPGEEARREDLAGELDHPVEVEEIVGDPDDHDDEGGAEQSPDLGGIGEDHGEEGDLRRDGEGHDQTAEHRDPAEPRGGVGVHIAGADLRG